MSIFPHITRPKDRLRRSKEGGFSLVEALVAIAILAFSVAGPMTLAARSLHASIEAKNELIATHLAEEGIEAVMSYRDNNSADGNAWDINISDNGNSCKSAKGCIIDITDQSGPGGKTGSYWGNSALKKCPGACTANDSVVYFNPTTGLYRQYTSALGAPWVKTNFTRVVYATEIAGSPNHETNLRSVVTYIGITGGASKVTVVDEMYDWFPKLYP